MTSGCELYLYFKGALVRAGAFAYNADVPILGHTYTLTLSVLDILFYLHVVYTVEPVLKDHPTGHKKCDLSTQVFSVDRFSYIEMYVLLPRMCGLSRQVASRGSGLSRQVSLYIPNGQFCRLLWQNKTLSANLDNSPWNKV